MVETGNGHLARAEARQGGGPTKTLAQLQAERLAQGMFADLMAGAGVGYNQIAKEVLFFLPKDFLDCYQELWYEGLAGKDDGGVGARGAAQSETGKVGKAPTRNVPGKIQISSGGAKRKSYKKYWVVADEEALAIKDRVDKRLRGIAREVRQELEELKNARLIAQGGIAEGMMTAEARKKAESRARSRVVCDECGRIGQVGWKYCPNDGREFSNE